MTWDADTICKLYGIPPQFLTHKINKVTHILEQSQPAESFLLIKKENIQRGDRVIFQTSENGKSTETEVILNDVKDYPGLMKNWKVISWRNEN